MQSSANPTIKRSPKDCKPCTVICSLDVMEPPDEQNVEWDELSLTATQLDQVYKLADEYYSANVSCV